MRKVDWRLVPAGGELALMTMDELVDGEPMMMADFRDTKALVHKATRAYVGLHRSGDVRLGRTPLFLRNGIWYVTEDGGLVRTQRDVPVTEETATLELIER